MTVFQTTRRPRIGSVRDGVGLLVGAGVGTASIPMATPIGTGRPRIYGVVRWPQDLLAEGFGDAGGPSDLGGHRLAITAMPSPRGIGTAATVLTTGFRRTVIRNILTDFRPAGGLLRSKVQAIYR